MARRSRVLVLIASLALVTTYFAPLWRIDLEAPQYPEGLGMRIWVNTIDGEGEWDLKKINQLNHYIGMKEIEPESIPELEFMPWLVALLMVGGIATAAVGRRGALYAWVGAFAVAAGGGLVDFWLWNYDYGHDLNPEAAIQIPGMSYQPPIIGSRQILNFTAHSWPGIGGWAAIAAFGLALAALASEVLGARRNGPETARPGTERASGPSGRASGGAGAPGTLACLAPLAVALPMLLGACAGPGPVPIAYGEDQGEYCRMTIADERYGAELVTRQGRVHRFDSIECLAGFRLAMADTADIHSLWVTDFADPPTLIRVEDAFFLESRDLKSPMGANLTAFGPGMTREAALHSFYGVVLSWDEVLERVRAKGAGPGHGTHSGHDPGADDAADGAAARYARGPGGDEHDGA
ncbi:MAG: nitrous oxide reductase accessory protein NosL, partial [Gemmatimonadota bacterium]